MDALDHRDRPEYHETIMAGAGKQAELDRVVKQEKRKYIAVVEGSIPTADDGVMVFPEGGSLHNAPESRPRYQC